MENFVKICEIITDTAEDTNTIMELVKKEDYAICHNNDSYKIDGADFFVMKHIVGDNK